MTVLSSRLNIIVNLDRATIIQDINFFYWKKKLLGIAIRNLEEAIHFPYEN